MRFIHRIGSPITVSPNRPEPPHTDDQRHDSSGWGEAPLALRQRQRDGSMCCGCRWSFEFSCLRWLFGALAGVFRRCTYCAAAGRRSLSADRTMDRSISMSPDWSTTGRAASCPTTWRPWWVVRRHPLIRLRAYPCTRGGDLLRRREDEDRVVDAEAVAQFGAHQVFDPSVFGADLVGRARLGLLLGPPVVGLARR